MPFVVKWAFMIAHLGTKVRRLRKKAGLSQPDLAERLGLSKNSKGFISEIERGKKSPSLDILVQLAQIFNVSTDYLLRDDLDEPVPPP